jgi:hypothetical protein
MTGNVVNHEFTVRVDMFDAEAWRELVCQFDDANLYQTQEYGAAKWGDERLSHIALFDGDDVVAAAQVTVIGIPLVSTGVAHVRFGPLWRRKGRAAEVVVLEAMLQALRAEYVLKRRLALRIKPWETGDASEELDPLRRQSGLELQARSPAYNTFVLDLAHSTDELYDGLTYKWRKDLRGSLKRDMQFEVSTSKKAVARFVAIYKEMYQRKGFTDFTEIEMIQRLQGRLDSRQRLMALICTFNGHDAAGILFTAMGDRALAPYGAATMDGLRAGASYRVNWEIITWLKQNRPEIRWYDLVGGLSNPGIRHFKQGIAKNCGAEYHMHDYDCYPNAFTRLVVAAADAWRPAIEALRDRFVTARNRPQRNDSESVPNLTPDGSTRPAAANLVKTEQNRSWQPRTASSAVREVTLPRSPESLDESNTSVT